MKTTLLRALLVAPIASAFTVCGLTGAIAASPMADTAAPFMLVTATVTSSHPDAGAGNGSERANGGQGNGGQGSDGAVPGNGHDGNGTQGNGGQGSDGAVPGKGAAALPESLAYTGVSGGLLGVGGLGAVLLAAGAGLRRRRG